MFRPLMTILFIVLPCLLKANVLSAPCAIPPLVDHFLDCFIEEQKENKLIGVAKMAEDCGCGIEEIGLLFDYFGTVDIPTARQMVVDLVNDFLKGINSQDKLHCYFVTACPLTPEQVIMRIRFRSEECGFIFPTLDNIAYVTATDGRIFYSTINSFTFKLDNLRMEPFPINKK